MTPAALPEKLSFLIGKKARYKSIRGGRGSSKSWSVARALLLLAVSRKLRILCAREVQNSIKESVHQLLSDQIQHLGLGAKYRVLDQEIRGKNGSKFVFSGLADQTVESIKSFEGVDIAWIEEGQVISDRSWKILIPTIRKEDKEKETESEIWVTWNPRLDTDPTFVRFVTSPFPGTISVEMNWRDNPWFPDVLNKERLHAKKTLPKSEYDNIWEGKCLPAVEGAIFHEEMEQMKREKRIRNVPYDPMLKAHVVWDLGFNDAMAIGVVQKVASEIRIIRYIEDSHRTLADYSAELKELRYNWGKLWLPFSDGFSKDYKTGQGADQILRVQGWNVAKKEEVANIGVETGIKMTRMVFPRIYVDETNCARLIECWKRYRRHINKQTMEAGAPLHDEYSHGGDFTRYVATNVDNMRNDIDPRPVPPGRVASYQPLDAKVGY